MLLATMRSVCLGVNLCMSKMVISPGFIYLSRLIHSLGSVTMCILPLYGLASFSFISKYLYLLSIDLSVHVLRNPVHWAVGSKTITATFLCKASSTMSWATTVFPEPVA